MLQKRIYGAIIDFIICFMLSIIIQQLVLRICLQFNIGTFLTLIISLCTLGFSYCLILTVITYCNNGQSIGKKIYHLRIVLLNGNKCDFFVILQRTMAGLVVNTAFGVGFIINIFMMFRSKYGFSIQDSYAQTKVVEIENE